MRRLVCVLFLAGSALAGPSAQGTSMWVCEPSYGIRYDVSPSLHLLWAKGMGNEMQLHEPLKVVPLSCDSGHCAVAPGFSEATMTFDHSDKSGSSGTYSVVLGDGTKQKGTFHIVPKKQRRVICE